MHTFKEHIINVVIPMIEKLLEKEKAHLIFLRNHNADNEKIEYSEKMFEHFTIRLKEYQEYANAN